MISRRPGHCVSRRPDRDGGFDPLGRLARLGALQPEQEQRDGDRGVVELNRAEQARLDAAIIVIAEPVIEPLS